MPQAPGEWPPQIALPPAPRSAEPQTISSGTPAALSGDRTRYPLPPGMPPVVCASGPRAKVLPGSLDAGDLNVVVNCREG